MRALSNTSGRVLTSLEIGGVQLYSPGAGQHIKTEYKYSAAGYKTTTHTFRVFKLDVIETVLAQAMLGSRVAHVKLGQEASGGVVIWGATEIHRLMTAAIPQERSATDRGSLVVISTADSLAFADVDVKTLARQGTISEIISSLTESLGFASNVIEPSSQEYSLIQNFQTNYDFMRGRLVQRAVNAQQQGNYLLFSAGQALHFHTPGYSSTVWSCDLTDPLAPEAVMTDNVAESQALGGSGFESLVYDPLTGQSTSYFSREAVSKRFGARGFEEVGAAVQPAHAGQNQAASEQGRAQREYEFSKAQAFSLQVTLAGQPGLRIGDLVSVVSPSAAACGLYFARGMAAVVDREQMTTVVRLVRGELGGQQGRPSVGRPVSVASAEASSTARDSGTSRTPSGGFVVPVQ